MTEILANGYSSENTQRELSNEYQYKQGCFSKIFASLCFGQKNVVIGRVKLLGIKNDEPCADRALLNPYICRPVACP